MQRHPSLQRAHDGQHVSGCNGQTRTMSRSRGRAPFRTISRNVTIIVCGNELVSGNRKTQNTNTYLQYIKNTSRDAAFFSVISNKYLNKVCTASCDCCVIYRIARYLCPRYHSKLEINARTSSSPPPLPPSLQKRYFCTT